jgi:hypothetical protein
LVKNARSIIDLLGAVARGAGKAGGGRAARGRRADKRLGGGARRQPLKPQADLGQHPAPRLQARKHGNRLRELRLGGGGGGLDLRLCRERGRHEMANAAQLPGGHDGCAGAALPARRQTVPVGGEQAALLAGLTHRR